MEYFTSWESFPFVFARYLSLNFFFFFTGLQNIIAT